MRVNGDIMGINRNSDDVWGTYIGKLDMLYSAMYQYLQAVAYLRSLNGVDITYGSARTDAFFNIQTVDMWKRFMKDIYGVEVIKVSEKSEGEYQESTRIFWEGETLHDEEEIMCKNAFYCVVHTAYEMLRSAGFKSEDENSDFPNQDDLLEIAENLLREIINLSPLVNPQTFFLLSLRYIPHGYATLKYGDLESIEGIMGWKRISAWGEIPEGWQIYGFVDPFWSRVVDSLHLLYGFCQRAPYWNASLDMWSIIANYIGENIHLRYFKNAKAEIMRSYGRDPYISEYVEGSRGLGDFLFAEVELKSLRNFEIANFSVEDSIEDPEFPLEHQNTLKLIAPQMFLNIGTMYLNENSRWTIVFYFPGQMLRRKFPEDLGLKIPDVYPIFVDRESIIPPEWKMHVLRNILETIDFHLEYLASMTEEYEEFGGDEK